MAYNIKKEKPKTRAWNVYSNGKKIDKVFYNGNIPKEDVREGLINHDNYNSDIILREDKKFNQEKMIKNNPYFVDGKDMSKVPIYTLEEENNGLTEDQEIALWQYGVDTGQVWHLQGWYGRNAQGMLDEGILQYPKERKYDYYGNAIPTREEVKKYKK